MSKIRIIITGGTFDKHYDELAGALTFKDSHLQEILTYSRCTLPVELEINQLKDSLDMEKTTGSGLWTPAGNVPKTES